MRDRAAQYRREAGRIREHAATATTPAVRQQLIDKAQQLEELADGLEKASVEGEETP
jgi:hypothetical protein